MTRTRKITLNVAAIAGALLAVGGWAVRSTATPIVTAINQHWVPADTFRLYQQGEALRHRTDSLVIDAKFDKLATPVNALYRACQRRRECP